MDRDTFSKTLSEVAPHVKEVSLHLMGEPLGHDAFADYVVLCHERGLRVNLTTNGMLLIGTKASAAMHPAVRQVNISVQSFAANFPTQNPDAYLQRVFLFLAKVDEMRPDLYVNLRVWDRQEPDADSTENRQLVQKILSHFGITELPNLDVRRRKNFPLRGRVFLHFDSRFIWPDLAQPVRSTKGFCYGVSRQLGIHADGTVVPCCLDKDASIKLGSLTNQSLAEIINSPRAKAMREGFENGELREDLCQRCDYIKRFDRKRPATKIR